MGFWDSIRGWFSSSPPVVEEEDEVLPPPPVRAAQPVRAAAATPAPAAPRAVAAPVKPPKPARPPKPAKPPKPPRPEPVAKKRAEPAKPVVVRQSEVLSAEEAERRYGELVRAAAVVAPEPVAQEAAAPPVEASPPPRPREPSPEEIAEAEARRRAAAESRNAAKVPRYEGLLSRADALLAVPEAEQRHLRAAKDELLSGWRQLGRPPESEAERLEALRVACVARFDARIEVFEAAARAVWAENLAARQAVVEQARALSEREDLRGAGPAMGELRSKLRACGPVSEEDQAAVAAAFAAAEQRLRERQEQLRAGRDQARAEQLEKLEGLVRTAESLVNARDPEAAPERVKQLQATWKTIRVPGERTEPDALWARFRAACDAVFERRATVRAEAAGVAIGRLQGIVDEAERHAEDGGDPDEIIPRLMAQWKKAGRAPRDAQDLLWERLQAAFGRLRAPSISMDLTDTGPAWHPFEELLKGRER